MSDPAQPTRDCGPKQTERIEAEILDLIARRGPDKTICPSEVARSLLGDKAFGPLHAPRSRVRCDAGGARRAPRHAEGPRGQRAHGTRTHPTGATRLRPTSSAMTTHPMDRRRHPSLVDPPRPLASLTRRTVAANARTSAYGAADRYLGRLTRALGERKWTAGASRPSLSVQGDQHVGGSYRNLPTPRTFPRPEKDPLLRTRSLARRSLAACTGTTTTSRRPGRSLCGS